jgi:hypothetical protein
MKPNRSAFEPEKASTDNGTTKKKDTGTALPAGMYRIPAAGAFIYASNNPADGFMFNRPGHPAQTFHAKGNKGAMIQAREHAAKNLKAHPLNWKQALTA